MGLEKQVDELLSGQDGQVTVKKQRPVNLDLTTISMPATAKASILHRVTGVALFFALTFVIWAWSESLSSPEGFEFVKGLFSGFIAKFIAWGTISVLAYHLIGGVRHIIMDMGHWEELESGNFSAKVAMALGVVAAILAGVWIWF
ncbi:succinate dehydrogenase, cytochrome b556 subunit [Pseudoalteromonas sp. S4389]|jgi:succinate dehydrogenase / fumarate reductase cytochrome b subunit|nr:MULTISPECIES: succinate dehydrogenase, cytochrome b556 subunit [unclassified Pseudoalteromonas]TMO44470.1 succinate dehydrogenase, cytochrome b556 subunit [Pseudoalteromonas sp. S4389]|tara:strand:- start:3552 stop:3986 length:435 start_codon:yes stop_codon:yes gene_type:complete